MHSPRKNRLRHRVSRTLTVTVVAAGLLTAGAAPTLAATCIKVTGEGVNLFFQFKGKLPKAPEVGLPLSGRFNGTGPAYGAATVPSNGAFVELAGGFAAGGVLFGLFNIGFSPPTSKKGGGGVVIDGVLIPVSAKIVSCRQEPKPQ